MAERNDYLSDYSLWRRDYDRQGKGRNGRPFVDSSLENSVDRAGRALVRHKNEDTIYLKGYGHSGKGPKGYKRSDERIKEDVCDALFESYDVDATHIEVDVKDACVYLKGEVDSRQTKRSAEDAVDGVKGVVDIQNQLTFKKDEPTIKRNISEPEEEHGKRLS